MNRSVAYGGTPEDEHSDQHSSSIYDNEDFCIKRPTVQCHLEEKQADKQNLDFHFFFKKSASFDKRQDKSKGGS